MRRSTGTAGTDTLPDEPPTHELIQIPGDLSYRMNRFLSEPRKDDLILLLVMDWEEEAMRENDAP